MSMNNNLIFSHFIHYHMALEALEYNMVFVSLKGLVPFYEIICSVFKNSASVFYRIKKLIHV